MEYIDTEKLSSTSCRLYNGNWASSKYIGLSRQQALQLDDTEERFRSDKKLLD